MFKEREAVMATYKIQSHLGKLMKECNVSVMDVVRGTGLSMPLVYRWVNDQVKLLDPTSVSRLCNFFDCTTDDLYTIVEE